MAGPSLVRIAALLAAGTALVAAGARPAAAQVEPGYAPVDRPGPPLSVPAEELGDSLDCPTEVVPGDEPIVLIPGTNLKPEPNFSWNYLPAFAADGRTVCTLTLPLAGMGDIQVAAEHVVHAIRTTAAAADGPVDLVGYSQGGMIGRWALRFWPDTRPLVDDLVGLAPSNHGTETAEPTCASECVPAYQQQRSGSAFVAALNSHQEAFDGVDYTVAYTWGDEVVTPNVGPTASSPIQGDGSIANIALQDVCPGHVADHLTIGTTDPVAYAIVVDALDNDGPADPARIDVGVCAEAYMPGVNPATLPSDLAVFGQQLADAYNETEAVSEEPPLACYVTASCDGGADTAEDGDEGGAAGSQATSVRPSTLPATGGGAGMGAVLLGLLATRRRAA